jgi:hypothetical protein
MDSSEPQLGNLIARSRKGVAELVAAQRAVLARIMVSPPRS